jgi:hypothetical protein
VVVQSFATHQMRRDHVCRGRSPSAYVHLRDAGAEIGMIKCMRAEYGAALSCQQFITRIWGIQRFTGHCCFSKGTPRRTDNIVIVGRYVSIPSNGKKSAPVIRNEYRRIDTSAHRMAQRSTKLINQCRRHNNAAVGRTASAPLVCLSVHIGTMFSQSAFHSVSGVSCGQTSSIAVSPCFSIAS